MPYVSSRIRYGTRLSIVGDGRCVGLRAIVGIDLRARDAIAQGDGLAVLVLGLGGCLYIIGAVAEGIVEFTVVAEHLDISAACGRGQFACCHCILLIKPVLRCEVDDVQVVVAIVGFARLGVGLDGTKVEFASGEAGAHHVDALADDFAGSAGHALSLELSFGSEVEFDGLDGAGVEFVVLSPEVEIEVVAHVGSRLAGALNHELLIRVCAAHHWR